MMIDKDIISSRQNADIIAAVKLSDKKARRESGLFRFDGLKLAREAIEKGVSLERMFVRASSLDPIVCELQGLDPHCRITAVTDPVFDKLSEEKSPEGIICIAKHLDNLRKIVKINKEVREFSDGKRVFLAESVRDPGNLGTLIRSANALGCERMILSSDCADPYNPRALRAAMGALFCTEICFADSMPDAISALCENKRRVFAAALDKNAVKLGSFDISPLDCFVVGNEGHGLSPETVAASTQSVYIPMRAGAESLNAATAASIILWEQERCALFCSR